MKRLGIIAVSLLLAGAVKAQTTPPISVKVGTGAGEKVLYQHGYNKGGSSIDTPREDRDSVMVGSTMPYFVMPDATYNAAYITSAASGSYAQTNLTTSKFTWTPPANGSFVSFVNPNSKDGNTSPHVTIKWNTRSSADPSTDVIKVVETPTEYNGQAITNPCPGQEVQVPVTVINKSTVKFGLNNGGREVSNCWIFDPTKPNSSTNVYPSFDFPLTLTTEVAGNRGIKVKYTVKKGTGAESAPIEANVTDITKLPVTFDDFGVYTVKITEITDPISRKCSITGDISTTATENVFTYIALPQPKSGATYHIPNNF
jgi:hypothetical protein